MFYSQNIKEPKPLSNHGYELLSLNTNKIKIPGVIDSRTGKQVFNNYWLYLALVCDKDTETTVRVNFRFHKPFVKGSKTKQKNAAAQAGAEGASPGRDGEAAGEEEDVAASQP